MAAVRLESLTSPETLPSIETLESIACERALGALAITDEAGIGYRAGNPGYPNNFTRDSVVAAILGGDTEGLNTQVAISVRHQAQEANAANGAEEGKFHHEFPSEIVNGASTAYNACDTTAWGLTGIVALAKNGYETILDKYRPNIQKATGYILRHVGEDGLFYEDPQYSGSDRYGLKVTYWKDSVLNDKTREEPHYPVVYSLAHFQNAQAIGQIAELTGDKTLALESEKMMENGIGKLWKDDHFVSAIDSSGEIDPPSSDSLHSLVSIPLATLPVGYASRIEQYMEQLETPAGYRTGLPVQENTDPYHTRHIWTHEQALLHIASKKHNLAHAKEVTERIVKYIPARQGIFPELIDPTNGYAPAGNHEQLWAVQAYRYFKNPDNALM